MQRRLFVLATLALAGLTTAAVAQPTPNANASFYYQYANAATGDEITPNSTITLNPGQQLTLTVYLRQFRANTQNSRNLFPQPAQATDNVTGFSQAGFTVLSVTSPAVQTPVAPLVTFGSFTTGIGPTASLTDLGDIAGAPANAGRIARLETAQPTTPITFSQVAFAPSGLTAGDYTNALYRARVGTLVLNAGSTLGTQTIAFADSRAASQTNLQDSLSTTNDANLEGGLDFPILTNVINWVPGATGTTPNYNVPAIGNNTSYFTLTVAPVPEPASFLLAGVTGVGMYVARRRKAAKAAAAATV